MLNELYAIHPSHLEIANGDIKGPVQCLQTLVGVRCLPDQIYTCSLQLAGNQSALKRPVLEDQDPLKR
jgi:hypothetical protein